MVFSRFIWTVLGLVALIVLTSVGLGIFLQKPEFPVTVSIFAVMLVVETLILVYYLIRIRKDLLRLIDALRHGDPTLVFKKSMKDPYFSAIHRGFNEIIRDFRLIRLDREAEHRFFKATIDHIQFGIIAFNNEGRVQIVNDAFLELFRLEKIDRTDRLSSVDGNLPQILNELSSRQESLKQVTIEGTLHHLIFLASRFRLLDEEISLVSVRDISRELDRNELEAWQKLLRVLRHEILNSVTPIKLLASNLSGKLHKGDEVFALGKLSADELEAMHTGLETIHRRATGLSNFLDACTTLYRLPELHLKPVQVGTFLEKVCNLFSEQSGDREIAGIECLDGDFSLSLDERLVEQVLINLIRNSMEATRDQAKPSIQVYAEAREKSALIGVRDNGIGIPPDQLESIFIPFYSTKEGGSGIGLSFSQHVMRLHNGQLIVRSIPGRGSDFQLVFPIV